MAIINGTFLPDLLIGTSDDDIINGFGSSDSLSGGDGNDTIDGGDGDDMLNGGGGNDVLIGGLGADTMIGDTGDDTYYVDDAGDTVIELDGGGNDRIIASIDYTLAYGVSVETLEAAPGSAPLSLTGNEGDQFLIGNGGDNLLDGGAGSDTAVFTGNRWYYTIVDNGDGTVTLADQRIGANDGVDTITNVEFVQFADGTFAFDTLLNAPPVAVDDLLPGMEDVPYTYSAEILLGNDTDGDLDTLEITGVSNVTGGTAVLNIDGTVTFTSDANFNGVAGFDYVVSDGNGGSDTGHAVVNVEAVNDAPVLTGDLTATVTEGTSYELTTADLNFTDPDDVAADVHFAVSSLAAGQILVNGTAASTFTAAELAAGKVTFVHDGSETANASFKVSVEDGNEDGSTPVKSTFNFTVTPVNDAPVLIGDLTATVAEGTSYELTSADLNFTDPDDTAAGVRFTVSSQIAGKVYVNGTAATSFTGAELAAGKVTFVHDGSETANASFKVSVEDGNEDGSTPVKSTFNFAVTPVNDAPVLTGDLTATVTEGTSYRLTTADLNFTDPDDTAAGGRFTVSSQVAGKLYVNGTAASTFTAAELAAGKVTFVHDGSEATKASFKVSVEDGNEDGSAPAKSTFNFTVVPVNDAPVLTGDLTATVREGTSYRLTTADLNVTDTDDTAAGVRFTVSSQIAGKVYVNGTAAASFTGAELAAGKVTFLHDGSETTKASFKVSVEDGNEDGSAPGAKTFTFAVTPVNDAPKLSATQVLSTLAEDASTASARKVASLSISDSDGGSNKLLLAGADAKLFEIKDGALWLKAGAKLDFETNPWLDVTVLLDDPSIGTSYEASKAFRIAVKDVNEAVSGTARNDKLTGTSGHDVLDGKAGNDILKGGAGNDTLIGGTGVDFLTGGAGRDTFVFATAGDSAPGQIGFVNNGAYSALSGNGKRDIVTDFVRGEDKLDLSKIDADLKLAGDQAFTWRGTGELSGKAGELIYRMFDGAGTANDKTIVYGDVDRDGRADFQIELAGIINLTMGDFIL